MSIRSRKLLSRGTLFYRRSSLRSVRLRHSASTRSSSAPLGERPAVTARRPCSAGTVQASVTASGNVSSATTTSLDFATSGTLTRSTSPSATTSRRARLLAKIDPSSAKTALDCCRGSAFVGRLQPEASRSRTDRRATGGQCGKRRPGQSDGHVRQSAAHRRHVGTFDCTSSAQERRGGWVPHGHRDAELAVR